MYSGSERVILHDNLSLYKFGEKEPEVEKNVRNFLNIHPKIVKSRKTKEAQSVQKKRISFSPELRKQFVNAICQGESSLKGDRYHMLVVTPVDDAIDEDYIKENLSFIKDINWRVVLDFGSDGSICKYMQSEEFRVRHAEEFDSSSKENKRNPLLLPKLKSDFQVHNLCGCVNGHEDGGRDSMSLKNWKQNRRNGVVDFLSFFKTCLNKERVTVVFLLLSKQIDVLVDVADTLCAEYPEQFICIAEDESVSKPWAEKLLSRDVLNQKS